MLTINGRRNRKSQRTRGNYNYSDEVKPYSSIVIDDNNFCYHCVYICIS